MKAHIREFFLELYMTGYQVNGAFPCRNKFSFLLEEDMNSLLAMASDEEIWQALFNMSPFKAP